jgi:FtsZ-interacting cell division protein ZipA
MRFVGLLIGLLALTVVLLPGLTAQEKEKDKAGDAKAEKKDADKKDADKKDPGQEKKEAATKEKKPVEEKPEHGPVLKTKIVSMRPDSARQFTIEVPVPDVQKMAAVQLWSAQRMQQIMATPNPQQRALQMYQFQMQLSQKQANETTSLKAVDLKASENCKVRSMIPPVEYDDAGNLKKRTKSQLDALRGNSKLPGYPSDFDMLKPGQYVEVYLAKPPKTAAKEKVDKAALKKKKMDDDLPDHLAEMPEVVMIVIYAEPMGR